MQDLSSHVDDFTVLQFEWNEILESLGLAQGALETAKGMKKMMFK